MNISIGERSAVSDGTTGVEVIELVDRLERDVALRRRHANDAHACDTDNDDLATTLFPDDVTPSTGGMSRSRDEVRDFQVGRFDVSTMNFTTGLSVKSPHDDLLDSMCSFFALERRDGSTVGTAGRNVDAVRVHGTDATCARREIVVHGAFPTTVGIS